MNITSVAHSLKLVDIERLALFIRTRTQVIVSFHPGAKSFESIPGTVRVSSTPGEKGYAKQITCSAVSSGYKLADILYAWSRRRLLALYTDARGHVRVCGSPEHPLRLTYTIADGVASITLTGTDSRDDGYLLVS